jgi:hypothetical protein
MTMTEQTSRSRGTRQLTAGASRASWLSRTAAIPVTGKPWRPDVLAGTSTRGLRYVVVDEIFSTLAELSMSLWPVIDTRGRLRFPEGQAIHLEADAERMRRYLRRHRQPRSGAGRDLRTGDTFGVKVEARSLVAFLKGRDTAPLSPAERKRTLDPATWDWLRPPVYDLSAEARVAAKLAYYGALTEPLPEDRESR